MHPARSRLENPDSDQPDTGGKTPPAAGRKTETAWLQCELCLRAASGACRLSSVFVHEDQPEDQDDGQSETDANPNSGSVVLLCRNCAALVRGQITESEWRRRVAANVA
jgi:hypothetical protein